MNRALIAAALALMTTAAHAGKPKSNHLTFYKGP